VRAVALDHEGQPALADVPEPTAPGQLVHVRACGLCGSDVEKIGEHPGTAPAGTVLGHEVEGVLDNGTRVTVAHRVACGSCERCRAGHGSTCEGFREVRIAPGGFAERLRASHVVPLPDLVGELDGIWVEPLACIVRAAPLVPEGRVAVVGCGAVGLLWAQLLLRRGCEVVAVEPRPERRAGAVALGASEDDDPVDAAVLTAPAGVGEALRRLSPGGTLLVFAAPAGELAFSLDAVYRKELSVVGSRSALLSDFDAAIAQLPSLQLPPTVELPLERFSEGLELYRSGRAAKVVFVP